jgi:glycyl-tRNA synthetase beta subunit
MVMDKNAKIRANRLALLKQAGDLFLVAGDFRKLVYGSESISQA